MDAQVRRNAGRDAGGASTYYALIALMTPQARARKVVALGRTVRTMARAGIRLQRPDASDRDVELELVSRLYGTAAAQYLAPYLSQSSRG